MPNKTDERKQRAERMYALIDGYCDNEDLVDCIQDVLEDLRHLCDAEELDFAALDNRGYRAYAERVFIP